MISKYNRWLATATVIVSILGPLTLTEKTIGEKIWIGLLINLQFHLAFQFLSKVPFGIYQLVKQHNPLMIVPAKKILILFSWVMIIFSLVGFIGFLNIALRDYSKLMIGMTFTAIFLGGYSSKVKFSED